MSVRFRITVSICFLITAMVFLIGPLGAQADTYRSEGYTYPKEFDNTIFGTNSNDLEQLDAVYFAGKEIVIFSLFSSDDLDYNKNLYFYVPEKDYHKSFDIENDMNLDFHFKTCTLNNVLYIFYTPIRSTMGYNSSTIYYRTVTVDYGDTGQDWELTMSDKKSFSAGHGSAQVRAVTMMNGNMYIIYTSGGDWYYISSSDGLEFSEELSSWTPETAFAEGVQPFSRCPAKPRARG